MLELREMTIENKTGRLTCVTRLLTLTDNPFRITIMRPITLSYIRCNAHPRKAMKENVTKVQNILLEFNINFYIMDGNMIKIRK